MVGFWLIPIHTLGSLNGFQNDRPYLIIATFSIFFFDFSPYWSIYYRKTNNQHFNSYSCFCKCQLAISNLLDVVHKLYLANDHDCSSTFVFHISNTFSEVNHSALPSKMHQLGAVGSYASHLQSYFTGCPMCYAG